MTSLEDISGHSCCGKNGDGVEFVLQSWEQLCTQLSLLHALKYNTCLCFWAGMLQISSYKKEQPGGRLPRAQLLLGHEDGSTGGSQPCSPTWAPAVHQGTVLSSQRLVPVSRLHLGPWEWCELVPGHIILLCVWRYAVCNKQIIAAASEEFISILSPSFFST